MKLIDKQQLAESLGISEASVSRIHARDPQALPTPISIRPLLWGEETVESWIEMKRKSSVTRTRKRNLLVLALATALAYGVALLGPAAAKTDSVGVWFDRSTSVSSGG